MKKLTSVIFGLAVVVFGTSAFANVKPICKTGSLPAAFHGTFAIPSSNTLITLTTNKLLFVGFSGGYFNLKSCVVSGKQVVTVSDANPQSTQNFSLSVMHNRNLLVEDLDTKEKQLWRFVRQ